MKCCINDVNFIRLLLLSTKLFKFEIQTYGQILCVHKPYFLMPGHKYAFNAPCKVPPRRPSSTVQDSKSAYAGNALDSPVN